MVVIHVGSEKVGGGLLATVCGRLNHILSENIMKMSDEAFQDFL